MADALPWSRSISLAELARAARHLLGEKATPVERFALTTLCVVAGLAALLAAWLDAGIAWIALLASLAYLFGGVRTVFSAAERLRAGEPDINLLMILAAIGAALVGAWHDGVLLLALFSLSDALEHYAVERTRRGVHALMKLRPDRATLLRDGRELTVPIDELVVNDLVRVRPGERFPIDGVVTEGSADVDESIVTGESLPVLKTPGSAILAGTINGAGSLLVRMTRPAAQSTIARIVEMVEQAQDLKPPAQRMTERYQKPYVLSVLALSAIAIVVWAVITRDAGLAVYRGMLLLVAASPCAVVLASPVAVLAAITRATRSGVLFKGGIHLERLAGVTTFSFDKTGTMTTGKLTVSRVEPLDGGDERELLELAASVAAPSEHPISRAIVAAAQRNGITVQPASEFRNIAGAGVVARTERGWVATGRRAVFDALPGSPPPEEIWKAGQPMPGETAVVVWSQWGAGGVIRLRDTVRPEAPAALHALRELGVKRFVMLTGDHAAAATPVAELLAIDIVRAGLRPEDKLAEIQTMAKQPGGVAMVGDGVNDAPALAAATVGVAMGAGGTDIALETADVVLLRDDLGSLAEALHIARHAQHKIQQGLLIAFGMIVLLVISSLLGLIVLPLAVLGHEGSTVVVVLNGLSLLRLQPVAERVRPFDAPARLPAPA